MKFGLRIVAIFLVQFTFGQLHLTAQKTRLPVFGEIDEAILNLKSCPFEPDAPAMVVFDYRKTVLENNGSVIKMITERHVRIKVFNEKGFKHANIIIPYLNRKRENRIEDISAVTYNIDASGKVTQEKIEKKQIFKEKNDETIKTVKFAFPGVKVGSVIEYRYTQVQKNTVRIEPWIIQTAIPIQSKILEIKLPNGLRLEDRKLFNQPVEIKDSTISYRYTPFTDRLLRYGAKEVRSFSPEPFMSSLIDNMQRVEFWIRGPYYLSRFATNWSIINEELNDSKNFGFWVKANIGGTNSLIDSAKKMKDKEEKIRYLFDRVKKRINWDGETEFLVDNLTNCWNAKSGNSAEINLLLTNLLLRSGVYCLPTLVSTRENGKVDKNYIRLSQFNSVVVWVPDEKQPFILDATRKHLSYQTTSFQVLNRHAFAVDSAAGQWIFIADNRMLDKVAMNILSNIDSAENLIGDVAVFSYDHAKEAELISREKSKEDDEETDKQHDLTISDYSEENVDDPLKPLIQKFKFQSAMTRTGELRFVNPLLLTSLNANPFIADERQTDVDMGPNRQMTVTIVVNLPDSIKPEFVPGNILLRSEDSSILFERFNSIEQKRIVLKWVLDIRQGIFTKEEYPALKEFYKKLYALLNEQIVLKKLN